MNWFLRKKWNIGRRTTSQKTIFLFHSDPVILQALDFLLLCVAAVVVMHVDQFCGEKIGYESPPPGVIELEDFVMPRLQPSYAQVFGAYHR